jgi:hypothetical protein
VDHQTVKNPIPAQIIAKNCIKSEPLQLKTTKRVQFITSKGIRDIPKTAQKVAWYICCGPPKY